MSPRISENDGTSEPVQPRDTPFMSNEALASDPGGVTIDPRRLRQLSPSLFGISALIPTRAIVRKILDAHPWHGDSRAAVVLSVQPLLVAAYSSDFDAVVVAPSAQVDLVRLHRDIDNPHDRAL